MASSQVEMASAPFGCVLRDHNRRDRCRESNARATIGVLQKNLKSLVRDHLCIAVSSNSGSNDNNSENQGRNKEPNKDENSNRNGEREDGSGSVMSPRHARVLDRWAFARQIVTKPIERQRTEEAEVVSVPNSAPSSTRTSTSAKEETLARTDSLADLTKKGVGASSLVQIWEKRLHKSESLKTNSNGNVISETSRSDSGVSCPENENENENENVIAPNASPSRVSEAEKAESPGEKAGDTIFSIEKTGDSVLDMEKARESIDESYDAGAVTDIEDSDRIAVNSRNLDSKEKEKVRVVDIIRRLTAQGPSSSLSEENANDNDQQFSSAHGSPCRDIPRELLRDRCSGVDQAEHRGLSHVISSPRIRGRQAFADLLMQMERDRHRELDALVNRKTVSKFPQRGRTRIQSLLRLRLLQRGVAFAGTDVPPLPPKASRMNKPAQGSSIMHLREKFRTSAEQGSAVQGDAPNPNSPHKEIIKNQSVNVDKSSTSNKPSENTPNREVNVMEQQKTFPVLRASEDVCEEATPSLHKSSTSNKPSESTPNREVNVMEQQKASPVLRASEDVCEEATQSLQKSSTSKKPSESTPNREVNVMEHQKTSPVLRASEEAIPSLHKSSTSNKPSESLPNREVNVMEQQKTSPVLRASEDVCEEVTPSLEVCFQETSSVSQSTLPNVSEDLGEVASPSPKVTWQDTSSVARNLGSQETADPTTPINGSNENEIWKGKGSVDRNLDSQETVDSTTSLNGRYGDDEIWKPTSSEARYLDSQQSADTRKPLSGGDGTGNEIWKGTNSEARNLDIHEAADTTSSLNGWNENAIWHGTSLEARNFDSQVDTTTSLVDWDENDDDYQYYGETNYDWISEISRPRSYWEDIRKSWYQEVLNSNSEKGEIHQLLERRTVSNFLSSDFRDRIDRLMVSRIERQTCHNVSQEEDDDESSYDRMNQMVSFLQQRSSPPVTEEAEQVQEHVQVQEQNQVQEQVLEHVQVQEQVREHQDHEDEEMTEEEEEQEEVKEHAQVLEQNQVQEQVLEQVQVQEQVQEHQDHKDEGMTEEEEEEENDDNYDDDEESRSLISGQFQEASDYFDRASLQPSPSHFTTWSYQDNEVGDDSDQATSPSPRQRSSFPSYYPNSPQLSPSPSYNTNHRQHSPSLSHPSMEMELLYDLRGHMIQLYQEMSELRKEIKSCVDMQMTVQQSMNQDVHSGQVGMKRNSSGLTKKGNCRICNEAKIDSLLYRCGHMCTCLKCAHDLQWNRGKCPICRAPIADVVKAYMDS
ncbi:putative transcription factor C2H2 family [Rosa chinensis]|uniref:Putative transcription factor C2H2 family n=1 Tax=Rosa chinensis TaxID=74649 RepID=A0A2P6Q7M7_ROSCH|nr:uncharacterized protein LOC112202699 [Rosa chinensis]PRQ30179.1 putative transcription factor C2H2 family [Rosa chinensis]